MALMSKKINNSQYSWFVMKENRHTKWQHYTKQEFTLTGHFIRYTCPTAR